MAGHSQYKNIMHRKNSQDEKKSRIFTKLCRDISIAIKEGNTSKIDSAIEKAREYNVPKKNIDNAMKKIENIGDILMYEGFVHGVGVMIEAITNNRNKSAAIIRAVFNKHNGSMSPTSHLFKHVSKVVFDGSEDDVLSESIRLDAYEYYRDNDSWIIICPPAGEDTTYIPINKIENISIDNFLEDINNVEEVQDIWTQLE